MVPPRKGRGAESLAWREDRRSGLTQLADYLGFQGLDHGFLLVFDFGKGKEYKSEALEFQGKRLFARLGLTVTPAQVLSVRANALDMP